MSDTTPEHGTTPPAVELRGIWKRFPGVIANHDVNLTVRAGTIHAIVGENGAGKSTLMNTLYGMHRPDEGTITIAGRQVTFRSPTDAIAAGIGMVHQHFMLADNLTVLENIVLGAEPTHGGRIDFAAAKRRIDELKDTYGIEIEVDQLTEHLGVGERQRVEILKVLYRCARILILDEPTAVLVPQEVTELFENVRRLVDEGVTVIFIDHKLDEVLEVSDDITVIRSGTTVATVTPDEVDARRLGELMVGSELPTPETTTSTVTDVVELSVSGVTARHAAAARHGAAGGTGGIGGRPLLDDVSFEVRRGEIVGIAGVEGNGQLELVEAILGLQRIDAGSIHLAGDDITSLSVRKRRHAGIGYIPFDRHREALLLESLLWENMILGHDRSPRFGSGAWISSRRAQAECDTAVDRFAVATALGVAARNAVKAPPEQQRSDEDRLKDVDAVREAYGALEDPEALYREPAMPTVSERVLRPFVDGAAVDLAWPSTFTAEYCGGTCMISPRKAASAARIASSDGRTADVPMTSPSASSVAVAAPQRTAKR